MKTISNMAILLAGAISAGSPMIMAVGLDDTQGITGVSGTLDDARANTGKASDDGTAGSAGTSGTAGTTGTAGTSGTSGTAGTFGVIKKPIANFSDSLLVVPCIEVKGSPFNGNYHVVFKQKDSSGSNWEVKAINLIPGSSCDNTSVDNSSTDDRLRNLGLPGVDDLKNR